MNSTVEKTVFSGKNNLFLLQKSSKKECIQKYKKNYPDQIKAKSLYYQILHELKTTVTKDDLSSFKHFCTILSYIIDTESQSNLAFFHNDNQNLFKNTNLIIWVCKHNKIEFLKYMFDDKNSEIFHYFHSRLHLPDDKDETGLNAFYYAMRSCTIKLVDLLIDYWPGNYFVNHTEKLDEILSQAYEALKLNNILMMEEMEAHVGSKLTEIRLSLVDSNIVLNDDTLLSFVKERIELLLDKINLLSSFTEVDEKFVYVGKFVAQTIHVLKRKLKLTYDRLPWEEIEFCFVSFIFSCTKKVRINLFYRAILNKSRILQHLVNFAKRLREEGNKINSVNIKQYCILPKILRDHNINQMIKNDPQFEELFKDYQQIKDLYSLQKMIICRNSISC